MKLVAAMKENIHDDEADSTFFLLGNDTDCGESDVVCLDWQEDI